MDIYPDKIAYIVYKTTNLINGKFYIGVHGLETYEHDRYFGSGKALNAAIRMYGRKNFKRETLFEYCGTSIKSHGDESGEAQAYAKEAEIVTVEFVKLRTNYNGVPGGYGGPSRYGDLNPFYGKKHTEEYKAEMSSARIGQYAGPLNYFYNNPQGTDKIWYTNGIIEKYIHKNEPCPDGFTFGRASVSESTRKKMSEKSKGKIKSDETRLKMSINAFNRPKTECFECGKSFDPGNWKQHQNKIAKYGSCSYKPPRKDYIPSKHITCDHCNEIFTEGYYKRHRKKLNLPE